MRLICPNCGAQYEVPDSVIPQEGRDVQCSSCGHTWFQKHPSVDLDLAEELQQPLPDEGWQVEEDMPAAEPQRAPEPDAEAEPQPAHDESEESSAPERARRQLDPEVARLLREEAEQEARARAAETAGALESQPDLGLEQVSEDEQSRRAREARDRMARMRGEDPEPAMAARSSLAGAAAESAQGSRRDLLPDIEEIKSTLRASDEPRGPALETYESRAEPHARSGFGRGFVLALLLGGILVALYILAPRLSQDIPALAPVLDGYASGVDGIRVQLDEGVTWLLTWMEGLGNGSAEG